jgi:hypothetical protein
MVIRAHQVIRVILYIRFQWVAHRGASLLLSLLQESDLPYFSQLLAEGVIFIPVINVRTWADEITSGFQTFYIDSIRLFLA